MDPRSYSALPGPAPHHRRRAAAVAVIVGVLALLALLAAWLVYRHYTTVCVMSASCLGVGLKVTSGGKATLSRSPTRFRVTQGTAGNGVFLLTSGGKHLGADQLSSNTGLGVYAAAAVAGGAPYVWWSLAPGSGGQQQLLLNPSRSVASASGNSGVALNIAGGGCAEGSGVHLFDASVNSPANTWALRRSAS